MPLSFLIHKRGKMQKQKKGLSTIIVTVILLALVLVAVGIVWAVYRGLISTSTEKTQLSYRCLGVELTPKTIQCNALDASTPALCNVTIERTGTNSESISGAKLIFRNLTSSSSLLDVSGNIEVLVGKKLPNFASTMVAPNEVDVVAYFKDEAGNELKCQNPGTLSIG